MCSDMKFLGQTRTVFMILMTVFMSLYAERCREQRYLLSVLCCSGLEHELQFKNMWRLASHVLE